jgi:hypothetical protein
VLALGGWGCSGDPTGTDLLLSFTVERFDPREGSLPADAAEGGDGTITVRGGVQTPCLADPSDLHGAAEKEGFALFLQIRLDMRRSSETSRAVHITSPSAMCSSTKVGT